MSAQQTLTGELLRSEIQQRGYAEFDHSISIDAIEHLVETYGTFTLNHPDPTVDTMCAMLPHEPNPKIMAKQLDDLDRSQDKETGWNKYRTNAALILKPDGYTNRSFQQQALLEGRQLAIDPPEDPKEYYHFTPRHFANMARNHRVFGWGPIPTEVEALNTAFAPIHRKAAELLTRVCAIIEETHPEINRIITPEGVSVSPLRLLFYHPSPLNERAGGHYDKGTLTFRIAESHQGLHVATRKGAPLKPVIRDDSKAVFFPARGLVERIPDTVFRPGWHNVAASDILNEGRSVPAAASSVCARWALIFFANDPTLTAPDKATTHSR